MRLGTAYGGVKSTRPSVVGRQCWSKNTLVQKLIEMRQMADRLIVGMDLMIEDTEQRVNPEYQGQLEKCQEEVEVILDRLDDIELLLD